eukprot:SAG25_NODE_106_length_15358_cov_22.913559_1_plen_49_part_10
MHFLLGPAGGTLSKLYFGREFALGATISAMAKFAHVTNRHKISYKLNDR